MQNRVIQLLQKQDKSAIEILYDQYGKALYGIVFRIVGTKESAEQVMQDTFIKAWQNGANYDETKGQLFTWLAVIARNTAIDATRSSHFRRSRQTDRIETLHHLPSDFLINADTLDLRDTVDKMDDKYRRLIDLVYFNEYTQKEAAEQIGLPLGTVKTRLRRAISSLRLIF